MSSHIPQTNINDGFNFALFLNTPQANPEQQVISAKATEKVQFGYNSDTTSSYNDFEQYSKNSKINNFLSKDLMKNLENFSPTKSYMSVGSQFNQLTLNELENEKKNDDFSDLISPINIRDNKHFKIDTTDNIQQAEKSIIQLISPANNEKQAFDFTKNNFIPRKNEGKITENKNEININYYANNISISNNNNNYYNHKQFFEQYNRMPPNIDYEPNYTMKSNNLYVDFYPNNLNNMNCTQQPFDYSSFPVNNNPKDKLEFTLAPNFNNGNFNYPKPYPNNVYREQNLQTNNFYVKPISNLLVNNNNDTTKKKRQFAERQGDWVCMKCKNLNFSFRVICNRCQLPKSESEALYMEHMNNLKKLNKQNDMLQSQIFNQNPMQMSNIGFNTNLFSPNTVYNPNTNYGMIPLILGKKSQK
jgi:hypothetical protein